MTVLEFIKDGLFMEAILQTINKFSQYTDELNEKLEIKKVKHEDKEDFMIATFNLILTTSSKKFSQKNFASKFSTELQTEIGNVSDSGITSSKIETVADDFRRFSKMVTIPEFDGEKELKSYTRASFSVRVVFNP